MGWDANWWFGENSLFGTAIAQTEWGAGNGNNTGGNSTVTGSTNSGFQFPVSFDVQHSPNTDQLMKYLPFVLVAYLLMKK